jgi:hypothetical protein
MRLRNCLSFRGDCFSMFQFYCSPGPSHSNYDFPTITLGYDFVRPDRGQNN